MDSASKKQGSLEEFQYEIFTTADGSPTLCMPSQNSEYMHHRDGALTESLYIYGAALAGCPQPHPSVLSVGLGLGYNELISIAYALKHEKEANLRIRSFEIEYHLRQQFLLWLKGEETPQFGNEVYDSILNMVAKEFELLPGLIKEQLLSMYQDGSWILDEALSNSTLFESKFNCILFDAFSKGTTPDLWDEEFLIDFIAKAATEKCVLTTYAATGALTRALKRNGFEVDLKKGFSGKRQSTIAFR